MVRSDGIVGAGVLNVITLGYGTVILCATLGGAGVSILGGSGLINLCVGDTCTTLVGAPGLVRRA